ncbi:MAG: hypothetical protein GY725_04200 [bacterium]|nr:hypothetical protein [bacterium]
MAVAVRLLNCFALMALVMMIGAVADRAGASTLPFGTDFTIEVTNFGGASGTVSASVPFDGQPDPVAGTSLTVTESVTILSSEEVQASGSLIETARLKFDITSPVSFSSTVPGTQTGPLLSIAGLNFSLNPQGEVVYNVFGSSPMYDDFRVHFSVDGVAQPFSDAFSQGLVLGPHPEDPSVPTVLFQGPFAGNPSDPTDVVFPVGAWAIMDPPWDAIELALELNGLGVNGIHIETTIRHECIDYTECAAWTLPESRHLGLIVPLVCAVLLLVRRARAS